MSEIKLKAELKGSDAAKAGELALNEKIAQIKKAKA